MCQSICLSATSRHCTKTAKRRITQTTPHFSPESDCSFLMPTVVGGRPPFSLKFLLKLKVMRDAPPFKHNNFDHYPLMAPQPWELTKKLLLALIGSWPRAFQLAIDEPCTFPLSLLKGGTKRDFAVFAGKIQLLLKEVCYKVSLFENFQRQGSFVHSLLRVGVQPTLDSSAETFMSVQCASPGREGELVGVCCVCASCVGWRKGLSRREQLVSCHF